MKVWLVVLLLGTGTLVGWCFHAAYYMGDMVVIAVKQAELERKVLHAEVRHAALLKKCMTRNIFLTKDQ